VGDTRLIGLLTILREGGLAVIYLGGVVTCLVLGLRKAGAGAWLGLGAFGLLLCNLAANLTMSLGVLPQAAARRWSLLEVSLTQSCCGAGLAGVAALLFIASLVVMARQRKPAPRA
jgi:hypothetical protein